MCGSYKYKYTYLYIKFNTWNKHKYIVTMKYEYTFIQKKNKFFYLNLYIEANKCM